MPISPGTMEGRKSALVSAARALIREKGGSGFSMRELAKKAGVSPATPYNLLSNKANLLALVVQDEFQDFQAKLGALRHLDAFDRLFGAVDLYPRIMALIENSISDFFGLLRMVPRVRWLNWFQERDGPFFTTCWNLPFWNIAKNRWSTPE